MDAYMLSVLYLGMGLLLPLWCYIPATLFQASLQEQTIIQQAIQFMAISKQFSFHPKWQEA